MAYAPELWIEIETLWKQGKSPQECIDFVQSTQKYTKLPKRSAVTKRARVEKWGVEKSVEILQFKEKSTTDFSTFLESQQGLYDTIITEFKSSIKNVDEYGKPLLFCAVKDVIALHKDSREVFDLTESDRKANEDHKEDKAETRFLETEEGRKLHDQYRKGLGTYVRGSK